MKKPLQAPPCLHCRKLMTEVSRERDPVDGVMVIHYRCDCRREGFHSTLRDARPEHNRH